MWSILPTFCYLILPTNWMILILISWCRKWGLEGARDMHEVPELGRVETGIKTQSGSRARALNGCFLLPPFCSRELGGLGPGAWPSGCSVSYRENQCWSVSPKQMWSCTLNEESPRWKYQSPSFLISSSNSIYISDRIYQKESMATLQFKNIITKINAIDGLDSWRSLMTWKVNRKKHM